MQIDVHNRGDRVDIQIEGVSSTIDDANRIKATVLKYFEQNPERPIRLRFVDTYVVQSIVIGTLIKLIHGQGARIGIVCGNQALYQLFDRLQLVQMLNVQLDRALSAAAD